MQIYTCRAHIHVDITYIYSRLCSVECIVMFFKNNRRNNLEVLFFFGGGGSMEILQEACVMQGRCKGKCAW